MEYPPLTQNPDFHNERFWISLVNKIHSDNENYPPDVYEYRKSFYHDLNGCSKIATLNCKQTKYLNRISLLYSLKIILYKCWKWKKAILYQLVVQNKIDT